MKSDAMQNAPERHVIQQPSRRQVLAYAGSALAAWTLPARAATYPPTGTGSDSRDDRSPRIDASGPNSLKARAAAHGLLAGFALSVPMLRESAAYREIVQQQCSVAVAEDAMKWAALRPAPDRFAFEEADELLAFTQTNQIKLRGHNLCWHEALPAWFDRTATTANARALLTEHIRTVAGRYAGRIHSWDVLNEAVHVADGRPDGLRNTLWLRLIGNDYIELAFRTAREADPAALLTYNEFGIESEASADQEKRAALLLLLRRLRQRNTPIDAVGIQCHLRAGRSQTYGPSLRRFIQSCRDLNLQVFLTEVDVDDRDLSTGTENRDKGVAALYSAALQAAFSEPNVHAVLTWGVADPQSWLNRRQPRLDGTPQRPLLFDESFRPKANFTAVLEAFASRERSGSPSSGAGDGNRLPSPAKPLPKLHL